MRKSFILFLLVLLSISAEEYTIRQVDVTGKETSGLHTLYYLDMKDRIIENKLLMVYYLKEQDKVIEILSVDITKLYTEAKPILAESYTHNLESKETELQYSSGLNKVFYTKIKTFNSETYLLDEALNKSWYKSYSLMFKSREPIAIIRNIFSEKELCCVIFKY